MSDDDVDVGDPWRAATDLFDARLAARLRVAFQNLGPIAWSEGYAAIARGEFRPGIEFHHDGSDVVFVWAGREIERMKRSELVDDGDSAGG